MRKWSIAFLIPVLLLVLFAFGPHQPRSVSHILPLRAGLSSSDRVTADLNQTNLTQALIMYSELTGRTQLPKTSPISQQVDEFFGGNLSRWHLVKPPVRIASGIEYHRDGLFSVAELKAHLEDLIAAKGLVLVPDGKKYFRVLRAETTIRPREWLLSEQKPSVSTVHVWCSMAALGQLHSQSGG